MYCEVFFAYAVVTRDSAVLFIDESQVDDSVKVHLGQLVSIRPYRAFLPYLKQLAADSFVKKEEVFVHTRLLDPFALSDPLQPVLLGNKTSLAVVEALGEVSCFDGSSYHFPIPTRSSGKRGSCSITRGSTESNKEPHRD